MISIVIPVHRTENPAYIQNTLAGIARTIGAADYNITLVGSLPEGFWRTGQSSVKWSLIPSTEMLGDAKNTGARYVIQHYSPDILIFMDAHINFFQKESMNWGIIIRSYLGSHPGTVVSPAISLYDKPEQRGFGVISDITEDSMTMDLKWRWWGSPEDSRPFEVPGLCGCFMAMSPETFNSSIIGFTPPLAIDDREFSIRIWELGKTLVSLPELTVGHRFSSGYTDFNRKRSIEWGMGMLLYTYLNIDEDTTRRLYQKGLTASESKEESWKLATSPYWRQVRDLLAAKRVRSWQEYFRRFARE